MRDRQRQQTETTDRDMTHTTVCYASETGTAEDVAFKILERAERMSMDVDIFSVEDYDVERLPLEELVVFVVSTTGDGEVPTTMNLFWKFLLRKSLPSNSLDGVRFAVFGLGDSGYDKFNAAARRLNSRLKQLGAAEFIPIGLGDDQAAYGYLTALDPWMDSLFSKTSPLPPPVAPLAVNHTDTPLYSIKPLSDIEANDGNILLRPLEKIAPIGYHKTTSTPMQAIVCENNRLTSSNWNQNVFHVSLALPPTSVVPSHVAGDVLIVHPSNSDEAVAMAEEYFNSEFPDPINTIVEVQYSWRKNTRKNRLLNTQCSHSSPRSTMQCSIRDLFKKFIALSSVPQRGYFEALAKFLPSPIVVDERPLTPDEVTFNNSLEEEREKLLELAGAEGAELYDSYCFKEQRSFLEVLTEFRSLRGHVPLHRFLELVPPLAPRHYSIASTGHKCNDVVQLCIAEVAYETPLKRKRFGVASHYLSAIRKGDSVYCYVRKGTFPAVAPKSPLLLIGPGTGVAPMRALLQERIVLAKGLSTPQEDCSSLTMLLFGCRSQEDDYLYENEWHELIRELNGNGKVVDNCSIGDNSEITPEFSFGKSHQQNCLQIDKPYAFVISAFSRKGRNAGRRVTNSLRTHQKAIWSLIRQDDAHILVAGSASTKMPTDVRKTLARVCESAGGLSAQEAQKFLLKMEKARRYCVEAWS